MACPTCDHTMQRVGGGDESPIVFWCPRCGTLKTVGVSLRGSSNETIEPPSYSRLLGDAVMFVRRMTHMLTGNAICEQATKWLVKHNIQGSILRDE